MTIVVAVLGVLLAIALLFIVALLRSHAEILRRLAAIEAAFDGDVWQQRPRAARALEDGRRGRRWRERPGGMATDIGGQTLAGDPVRVSFGRRVAAHAAGLHGHRLPGLRPAVGRVARRSSPDTGGRAAARRHKGTRSASAWRDCSNSPPAEANLVMSTRAWSDFGVTSTPHFVLVRGGEIAGRGSATSWAQITTFLTDAEDDDRIYSARALDTNGRAGRAERALADAGIGPDHPSLYPSRESPTDE